MCHLRASVEGLRGEEQEVRFEERNVCTEFADIKRRSVDQTDQLPDGRQPLLRITSRSPVIPTLRQPDTSQQVFHARIGAQRAELWVPVKPHDKPWLSLLVGFLKRCEGSLLFSQPGIDGSKIEP
jgi:hypothetical protein